MTAADAGVDPRRQDFAERLDAMVPAGQHPEAPLVDPGAHRDQSAEAAFLSSLEAALGAFEGASRAGFAVRLQLAGDQRIARLLLGERQDVAGLGPMAGDVAAGPCR